MASHLDSATETDGAEPEPEQYQIAAEVVDVELDRQQEQLTKRVDDEVVLTASEYDEIVKRQQVTERLYDQLHEERRQRLDISEKYRRCSEALARENGLVMRYRQLLIKNRLQLKPKDEICVGDELPETFFQGEEFELSGRCPAAGSSTESVQTTEEVTPWEVDMTSSREHQSVLESDEAVVIAQPVFTDAGLPSWNDHRKYSAKPANVSATESAVPQSRGLPTRQLVDEANDAMKTVPTTTSSTTSHDLLQKVLEQNARLKNILRKIVDTQSMTIRDLLERSDYAELVERMQKEIDQLRSQVKDKHQQLVADDTNLTVTCAALTDKVQRLEHSSAVKQALLDVYSAECVRLQSELKRLSTADAATGSDHYQSHHQRRQPSSPLMSRDSAATANVQKISQDFVELRQKYLESEKLSKSRLSELELLLCQKTKQVEQLETDKKELENKLRNVLQQINDATATKAAVTKPKTAAKLASCSQSRQLDRPWMTSLPQTQLMVDCGSSEEAAPPPLSSSSSSSARNEKQQQLGTEDDDGVGGCEKPCESEEPVTEPDAPLAAHPSAAGDAEGDEDDVDGKVNRVYICARCYREFRDESCYRKHCKKCCDD